MGFAVGDLIRFKSGLGWRGHLGVVKGLSDSSKVLDVFWLSDPSMDLKPRLAEVELLK